jgi:hypothetical protein
LKRRWGFRFYSFLFLISQFEYYFSLAELGLVSRNRSRPLYWSGLLLIFHFLSIEFYVLGHLMSLRSYKMGCALIKLILLFWALIIHSSALYTLLWTYYSSFFILFYSSNLFVRDCLFFFFFDPNQKIILYLLTNNKIKIWWTKVEKIS